MRTIFNWYAIVIALVLACTGIWLFTGEIFSSVILAPLCVAAFTLIEILFAVGQAK